MRINRTTIFGLVCKLMAIVVLGLSFSVVSPAPAQAAANTIVYNDKDGSRTGNFAFEVVDEGRTRTLQPGNSTYISLLMNDVDVVDLRPGNCAKFTVTLYGRTSSFYVGAGARIGLNPDYTAVHVDPGTPGVNC